MEICTIPASWGILTLWSQGQLTDFVQNMLMHFALSTIEWEVDTRKRI